MLEYQESVQPTDISRWSWQPGSVSATSQGGLQFTAAQLRPPKKDSWGSVKPPSYATWSCRETPWREVVRRRRTEAKVEAKVDAHWRKRTETPSTRCPSRAVQQSPQLRTPSPDAFVASKAPSPVPMDAIPSPSRRLGPSQWSWLLTHQGDRDCMASLMSDASCVLAERYSEPSAVLQDPADEHSARHAETMEGLRVASMVMGEKARGPVTLGIRVKAVQRLAVASALRQLVHLPAGRQQEDQEMKGDSAAISPSSPRSLYSMETDNTPQPSESSEEEEEAPAARDSLAAMLSSAAKSCKLSSKIQQTRFREVLANSTLGKMVKAHPEKAAKFGLAVVPKWSHNKPWPPPPVVAHFSSQPSAWALRLLQKTEDRKKKEEEGARRRMSTNMERRFTRKMSRAQTDGEERMPPENDLISDLASAVTSQRKRTPRTSMFKGQGASMRRYSRPDEEERLQDILDHAVTIIKMNIPEKDSIINCFLKHSETTPGHLSSKALLRGFAEMEIRPKTFREKQTIKQVQELVIKKYRKEDKNFEVDGIQNPLKHKKGGWLFEEFLAMTATYKEIAREEQMEVDQALADQNSCELAVIREFRKVYNGSRSQEQMIVKDVLAILAKVGIRNPSDKELALLLNLQLGANMELSRFRRIAFADFIPAMLKIQGMLAQVQGDLEEES